MEELSEQLTTEIFRARISKSQISSIVGKMSAEMSVNPISAAVSIAVVESLLKELKSAVKEHVITAINRTGIKTVHLGEFQIQMVESQKKDFMHCSYYKHLKEEISRVEKLMSSTTKSLVDPVTKKRIPPAKYVDQQAYYKVIIPK